MTRTESRAEIGALGEQLAVDHLQGAGLRVLARNWRCRYGELDVIAADDAASAVSDYELDPTSATATVAEETNSIVPEFLQGDMRLVVRHFFSTVGWCADAMWLSS